jgi:type IV pilus assembly protein PilX
MRRTFLTVPGRQSGAVLVVGLIMLIVISLMGAVAYGVATQQERISGNTRDKMLAFEMAESALRLCEADLRDINFARLNGGNRPNDGMYTANAPGAAPWFDTVNWSQDSQVRELTLAGDRYALRPACIGEDLGSFFEPDPSCAAEPGACPEREIQSFRVTARGFGVRAESVATVQSTFRR